MSAGAIEKPMDSEIHSIRIDGHRPPLQCDTRAGISNTFMIRECVSAVAGSSWKPSAALFQAFATIPDSEVAMVNRLNLNHELLGFYGLKNLLGRFRDRFHNLFIIRVNPGNPWLNSGFRHDQP
jgi:hypothetical protein